MNRSIAKQLGLMFLVMLTWLPMSACSKEKAEALKSAAESFRDEAIAALVATGDLIRQSVSLPVDSNGDKIDEFVAEFNNGEQRSAEDIQQLVEEVLRPDVGSQVNAQVNSAVQSVAEEYELFADMFRSLPRGHFFAKGIVPKAQRHAIRLTKRLLEAAKTLQQNPVQFRAERVLLIERLEAAQKIDDPVRRSQAITLAAQQTMQLREEEQRAKNAVVAQCLKAAQAGAVVSDLIDGYEKLTIGDILDLTRNSLALADAVTGGSNAQIQGLQTRLDAFVKNKIENDPIWKDALKEEVPGVARLSAASSPGAGGN